MGVCRLRIAFVALAVTTPLSAEAQPAPPTSAVPATAKPAAPATPTVAGFRMEGDPLFETVFGDADQYRGYINQFFAVHDEMQERRAIFGKLARQAVTVLASERRGPCPEQTLAPLYARAHAAGQKYRALGAKLEARYQQITELDELGETAGLTPDYQWKVNRVRKIYGGLLADYREMRAVFEGQLAVELRFRRCNAERLLALGATAPLPAVAVTAPPRSRTPPRSRRPRPPLPQPPSTAAATFMVDNERCATRVTVFVDSIKLGEVPPHAKAAFQTTAGRHALCLLTGPAPAECGTPGTVRNSYVHDGWSISLRCE